MKTMLFPNKNTFFTLPVVKIKRKMDDYLGNVDTTEFIFFIKIKSKIMNLFALIKMTQNF
jgi:hypothetical protein